MESISRIFSTPIILKRGFDIPKNRNVLVFLVISFLHGAWFVEAVWFFYWARFASYTQIALMFSVLTIVWILAEIPTGVFADKYGRKLSTVVGSFLMAFGAIFIAGAQNAWWLFIGGFIENVGRAFVSGALEALVYDDLKTTNQKDFFAKVLSASTQLSIIAFASSVLIGGFLYRFYFRLPNILFFLSLALGFISSLFLVEQGSKSKAAIKPDYIRGFKELAKKSLRPFIIPAASTLVLFFLYDWGLSKPAMAVNFGFFERGQALIYSGMAVVSVYVVGLLPKMREKIKDLAGLRIINLLICTGFILAGIKLGYIGVIVLLLIELGGVTGQPWISTIINNNISSEFRATTLSSLQFISKIPFIAINFIGGIALDRGVVNQYHLIVGLIALTVLALSLAYKGKPNYDKSNS